MVDGSSDVRDISKIADPEVRECVSIVLVNPRNPLNIGAVARAMSNFGFRDLRLVMSDYRAPLEEARSAINAESILHSAQEFSTLGEAIADCTMAYATTAVGDRDLQQPVDILREASVNVASHLANVVNGRIAILFGSEKHGLSNESISHCHRILTIPMQDYGSSMNLGQSAAVCLYELVRDQLNMPRISGEFAPATAEQLQVLDRILEEAVEESEYPARFPGRGTPMQLREYSRRLNIPSSDVPVWIGFLRQFLWKMRGNKRD